MKFLNRLLNRREPKRYCRYPWEDFSLRSLDYEYTFSKKTLSKGFALTSADDVVQMLEANKLCSEVTYSRPRLVDDGKGYGMWMTRIDNGKDGAKGYSLLIPAFEDRYGTKRVIVAAREDFNPPEAGKNMQLENWGAAVLKQSMPAGFDFEMVEKKTNVYHVPVFGYDRQTRRLLQQGTRKVVCEEGKSFYGEKISRVINREAVVVNNQSNRFFSR